MAWYNTVATNSDTVISTRVRLARNITGYPFASRLDATKAGEIIEREIRLFDTDYTADISWHFGKYDTAFRYRGCTTQGFIGNAPTQLCHARGLLETVKLIFERSGGIDPLASEKPIPPKWYC